MKKLVVKTSLWFSALAAPVAALAQDGQFYDPQNSEGVPSLPSNVPNNFDALIDVIITVAQWMFGILMALGIVFILYAAFLYLLAQGNEEKIENAKRVLIYSVVALVIAVLAGGVSVVVQSFVSGVS